MQLYSCIRFGLQKFVNSERRGGSCFRRLCRQRVTVSRSPLTAFDRNPTD